MMVKSIRNDGLHGPWSRLLKKATYMWDEAFLKPGSRYTYSCEEHQDILLVYLPFLVRIIKSELFARLVGGDLS